MAASQEQKVDYLLKKLGYSASKTGIAEDENNLVGTKKAPFAEAHSFSSGCFFCKRLDVCR